MASKDVVSAATKIAACARVLANANYACIQDFDWLFVEPMSQEAKDIVAYGKTFNMTEYDSIVFMYACFNLLFMGDDNF